MYFCIKLCRSIIISHNFWFVNTILQKKSTHFWGAYHQDGWIFILSFKFCKIKNLLAFSFSMFICRVRSTPIV